MKELPKKIVRLNRKATERKCYYNLILKSGKSFVQSKPVGMDANTRGAVSGSSK